MSFINKSSKSSIMQEETAQPLREKSRVQMKIDVVPIPTGASSVSSIEKREVQQKNIHQILTRGKDLFEENSTIISEQGSNRLYQTADLYSESLSLEELIPMLTSSDLTLKLNAVRIGRQSSSTCMELKSGVLADIIEKTSVDERNEKTCSVSLQTSKERGSMFVGIKVKGGKHFIQKLDYEIHREQDEQYHVDD
jgi:hypothetical protein